MRGPDQADSNGSTDAIRKALALRDHHLRGTPEPVRDRCQCLGCEMGRVLEGKETISG